MISNPPPEVGVLKNKAEEPAKDEPLAKKIKTQQALPIIADHTSQNMSTTISLTVNFYYLLPISILESTLFK